MDTPHVWGGTHLSIIDYGERGHVMRQAYLGF